MTPPKPQARAEDVSLWRYWRLFRKDILSAQPARLYRAWMAEFRTPFFRSYLINQPDLIRQVLNERPMDFPKSGRVGEGLRPLLGNSVFLSNGETWLRQRRIIDPAFEGGKLRGTFPAMAAAGRAAIARLATREGEIVDIEQETSFVAADVIFRTLFSIPIEDQVARQVFTQFQNYQRSQPILNLGAMLPLPRWMPRMFKPRTKRAAKEIRRLVTKLTDHRQHQIAAGTAPDDLVTKIMTQTDPQTGQCFDTQEMVDQVAIFFLAGHETSASALAWALYLLALYPDWQDRVAKEAADITDMSDFSALSKLKLSRDVFRETLRLYPPVPMMVRENMCPEQFRNRDITPGAQIVLSPWHLHRHTRLWEDPDAFRPDRWGTENGKDCLRNAYLPFSSGPRVCPGAGFAMAEGPLLLSMLVNRFRFQCVKGSTPVPVAYLTVRSVDGIKLGITLR